MWEQVTVVLQWCRLGGVAWGMMLLWCERCVWRGWWAVWLWCIAIVERSVLCSD